MVGGYTMDLAAGESPTAIDTIETILTDQEATLREPADHALVDMVRIKEQET